MNLPDALQLILHRVFNGDDVSFLRINPAQGCVDGRRLSASRGARDENDAACPCQMFLQGRAVIFLQSHFRQADQALPPVQQSQHRPFAENRGDNRYPEVEILSPDENPYAAILRKPLLGNVEFGHDLHPADQRLLDDLRWVEHLMEYTVNPHAHLELLFIRLDVDIAGPLLDGLLEQGVQKADDGSVFDEFQKIAGFFKFRGYGREVIAGNILHNLCGGAHLTIGAADGIDQESLFRFQGTLLQAVSLGEFGNGINPPFLRDGREEVIIHSLQRENEIIHREGKRGLSNQRKIDIFIFDGFYPFHLPLLILRYFNSRRLAHDEAISYHQGS